MAEATVVTTTISAAQVMVFMTRFSSDYAQRCAKVLLALYSSRSRLARNGRDWQTLLEFCRLVNCLLIDHEDIYDPKQCNDRLLLGMKVILPRRTKYAAERSQTSLAQKRVNCSTGCNRLCVY
jgi:hypothetical protein